MKEREASYYEWRGRGSGTEHAKVALLVGEARREDEAGDPTPAF